MPSFKFKFISYIFLINFFLRYATADVPFAVPSNVDCNSLNKLINKLLRENHIDPLQEIDFDFLVLGELLRVNLIEHLKERGISTEATIDVEYVLRTPAPEPQDSLLHDDWVSSVQVADKWYYNSFYCMSNLICLFQDIKWML